MMSVTTVTFYDRTSSCSMMTPLVTPATVTLPPSAMRYGRTSSSTRSTASTVISTAGAASALPGR